MYKLKQLYKHSRHKRFLLITAAVVMIMTAAVCFIYAYGNSQTIPIETEYETNKHKEGSYEIEQDESNVFVDISGCIKDPGVYEVPPGSRIFEVVEKAGGFTKNADTALINQAERVTDGMKINVPDKRKPKASGGSSDQETAAGMADSLININTADSDELQRLPGIGPVTAEKIIQYRESNGSFRAVDDIKNVSGIGDKTLQKIRSSITV